MVSCEEMCSVYVFVLQLEMITAFFHFLYNSFLSLDGELWIDVLQLCISVQLEMITAFPHSWPNLFLTLDSELYKEMHCVSVLTYNWK